MAKFLVCNKWELEIDDSILANVPHVNGPGRPYLQFVNKVPKQVGAEAWAIERLFNKYAAQFGPSYDESFSMAEYLGGIGMTATIARNILSIDYHVTNDWNPYCYKHLGNLMDQGYYNNVYNKDWMGLAGSAAFDCDIVHVDFNSFTFHQLLTNNDLYMAWKAIFALEPQMVLITDSAITHLHLNGPTYERHVDMPVNGIHDYIRALSTVIHREFDYAATHAACHSHAICVMLRRIEPPNKIEIAHAPKDSYKYFRRIDVS